MPESAPVILFASHGSMLTGGAERGLLEAVIELHRSGEITPVVSAPEPGPLVDELRSAGVPTAVVPTPKWTVAPDRSGRRELRHRVGALQRSFRAFARYRAFVERLQPQAMLSNTLAIGVPAAAAYSLGIPHVWWIREFQGRDDHNVFAAGLRASRLLMRATGDATLVHSRSLADMCEQDLGLSNPTLITYGLYLEPGVALSGENADEPLRLLALGRIDPGKNLPVAIHTMSRLERTHPGEHHLVIQGKEDARYSGGLSDLITSLGLEHAVELRGFGVSRSDVIDGADVMLVCSRREGYGRITAESLRRGRPIVGSSTGATPELVDEGVSGLLFHPDDPDGLAAIIQRLGSDRPLLARMSADALREGSRRFRVEDERSQLLALFRSVVAGTAGPAAG